MKNNLNNKIEYDLKFCFSLKESLKIMTFYEIFYMPYKRWIDLIKRKIDIKIEKCIENEKSDVLTEIQNLFRQALKFAIVLRKQFFYGS